MQPPGFVYDSDYHGTQAAAERKLLLAVLMRAIQDYAQPHVSKRKVESVSEDGTIAVRYEHDPDSFVGRNDYVCARDWIEGKPEDGELFSFEFVCQHLNFDAEAVRAALRRLKSTCSSMPSMNNATFYSKVSKIYAKSGKAE